MAPQPRWDQQLYPTNLQTPVPRKRKSRHPECIAPTATSTNGVETSHHCEQHLGKYQLRRDTYRPSGERTAMYSILCDFRCRFLIRDPPTSAISHTKKEILVDEVANIRSIEIAEMKTARSPASLPDIRATFSQISRSRVLIAVPLLQTQDRVPEVEPQHARNSKRNHKPIPVPVVPLCLLVRHQQDSFPEIVTQPKPAPKYSHPPLTSVAPPNPPEAPAQQSRSPPSPQTASPPRPLQLAPPTTAKPSPATQAELQSKPARQCSGDISTHTPHPQTSTAPAAQFPRTQTASSSSPAGTST